MAKTNTKNKNNSSKKETKRTKKRWLIALILLITIIIVVSLAYFQHDYSIKYSNAQQACSSASAELNKYSKEYGDLLSGKAADASKITTDQVTDAKTVEILASEMKVKSPSPSSCNGKSISTLTDSTNSISKQTNWFKSHIESLDKAIKEVEDSKTQKDKEIADTKAKADADAKAKAEQETQRQAQQTQQSAPQTRTNVTTTTRKTNATYRTSTNKSNASNYRSVQTTTTRPNLNGGYGCGNNCPPASSDGKIHR